MVVFERVCLLRPTAVNTILQGVRTLQAEGPDLVSLMRGEPPLREAIAARPFASGGANLARGLARLRARLESL